jgi:hypothetical protein
MSSMLTGLVGGLLGAMAALMGSFLTARLQARHDRERWQRDRRQAAYDGATRSLLRWKSRRSELLHKKGRVFAALGEDGVGTWVDDLIEAQFWLHALTAACGDEQRDRLREAASEIDKVVDNLTDPKGTPVLPSDALPSSDGPSVAERAIEVVRQCAREDMHGPPRF